MNRNLGSHPGLGVVALQCHEQPRSLPSAILSVWFSSSWSSDGCWNSSHQVHIASGKVEGPRAKCACQLAGSHPTASTYVSLARFSSMGSWHRKLKYWAWLIAASDKISVPFVRRKWRQVYALCLKDYFCNLYPFSPWIQKYSTGLHYIGETY